MTTKIKTLLGGALLVASAAASAQGYAVLSAGASQLDLDCAGAPTCDKSGTAFKLLGGYSFAPNMAAEFGYFDFGKARAADSTASLDIKTTAFGGGIAFRGDFSPQWNYAARLGLAQVKTKLSATLGSSSGTDSDNNAQLYVGLGVGYKLNKTTSLDLAFDTTKSKYDKNGVSTSGNVNAFSVGVTVGF